MSERDDGLGIFADVITGALGIVMFTALFFALRALASPSGIAGIEVRPELQAELARQRLDVAEARLARAEAILADRAASPAAANRASPDGPAAVPSPAGEAVEAARRRDFARQQQRKTELEILAVAAEQAREALVEQQRAAREDFRQKAGAPLAAPLPRSDPALRPCYVLVKRDRAYPLFHFRDGRVHRDTEHVGWLLYDQGRQMRAFPQTGHGWAEAEAVTQISGLANTAALLGWQVSLLVEADGFGLARDLVRALRGQDVAAPWRPIKTGDYLSFSVDSLPPP